MSVVEQVYDDGQITVREGNFKHGFITSRKDYPRNMNVIGYYRP